MLLIRLTVRSQLFRSTGSYEPDPISFCVNSSLLLFRSTGSYEPDRVPSNSSIYLKSFDPQALTSLTETGIRWNKVRNGFDPQALTSLTRLPKLLHSPLSAFRSTGSYEPDPYLLAELETLFQFRSTGSYEPDRFFRIPSKAPCMFRSTGSYEPDHWNLW